MPVTHTLSERVGLKSASARAGAILLAAALLFGAPAIAQAAFSGTATAPVTTSTLKLVAPAVFDAVGNCPVGQGPFKLNVNNYSDVPGATAYMVVLTAPDGTTTNSGFTTAKSISMSLRAAVSKTGTWTFSVRGYINAGQANQWTGDPAIKTKVC